MEIFEVIKIYLVGQISEHKLTFEWREEVCQYFSYSNSNKFEIINPCGNIFAKEVLRVSEATSKEFRDIATLDVCSNALISKDLGNVIQSDIGLVNLNRYKAKYSTIGSFFELGWYYYNPQKTVIGIFDGEPEKDTLCWHPFVRQTIDVWTQDIQQACKLIEKLF